MMMNPTPSLRSATSPKIAAVSIAETIPSAMTGANAVRWKRVAAIATAYAPTPNSAAWLKFTRPVNPTSRSRLIDDREDPRLREQRDVERRDAQPRQQQRDDEPPRRRHHPAPALGTVILSPSKGHSFRPNRPCGRNAMISATGTKIVKYESSGNSALPNAFTRPISRLPTSAPDKLPIPPTITTAKASGVSSPSSPGYALVMGPPSSPPSPAMNAPAAKTT